MADLIRVLDGARITVFRGTPIEIEQVLTRLRDDDQREAELLKDNQDALPKLMHLVPTGQNRWRVLL